MLFKVLSGYALPDRDSVTIGNMRMVSTAPSAGIWGWCWMCRASFPMSVAIKT